MQLKKVIQVISVILLWGSCAAYAEVKIGVIDRSVLLEKAPQAEAARNKLQKEFAGRDEELVTLQKKMEALQGRLKRDTLTLSKDAIRNLEKELLSKKRKMKRLQEEFREDFNIRRNEELAKLQKKVSKAILLVAKKGKYDFILSEGVIYLAPDSKANITKSVLKELNKIK